MRHASRKIAPLSPSVSVGREFVRMIPRYCSAAFLNGWMLCIDRKACRWCSLRVSTCWQMDVRSRSLTGTLQGIVIIGSSEIIRVPLEIFSNATRPFPFPGTSCKAHMELPVVLYIVTPPAPSKFPLFSFAIEIATVSSDKSSVSSRL